MNALPRVSSRETYPKFCISADQNDREKKQNRRPGTHNKHTPINEPEKAKRNAQRHPELTIEAFEIKMQ